MIIKNIMPKIAIGLWSSLGFYRGYESYENKSDKLKAIGYGICAIFIYINPISLPLILEFEYKKFNT